jgi:hypothetical protein
VARNGQLGLSRRTNQLAVRARTESWVTDDAFAGRPVATNVFLLVEPSSANNLAGTIVATSTVTGTLTVTKPLAGTVAGTSTVTGTLSVSLPLAGTIVGTSTVTGTLTVTKPLAGTIAGASTVTGTLTVMKPLAGTIAASSSVTGTLTVTMALAGTIGATSTVSGTLTVTKPLAGTITGTSTAIGTLTLGTPLAGSIVAISSLAGDLTRVVLIPLHMATITEPTAYDVIDVTPTVPETKTSSLNAAAELGTTILIHPAVGADLMQKRYVIGETAVYTFHNYDSTGTLADASTLTATITPPYGTATTYTYGVDGALVRDSTGVYHVNVALTLRGTWRTTFNAVTGAYSDTTTRTTRCYPT